jgi:hypothetical protein
VCFLIIDKSPRKKRFDEKVRTSFFDLLHLEYCVYPMTFAVRWKSYKKLATRTNKDSSINLKSSVSQTFAVLAKKVRSETSSFSTFSISPSGPSPWKHDAKPFVILQKIRKKRGIGRSSLRFRLFKPSPSNLFPPLTRTAWKKPSQPSVDDVEISEW